MDYSTLPNDPDHPGGSSPWSTSPQASRTTFSRSTTGDIPQSPLPSQTPYGSAVGPGHTQGDSSDSETLVQEGASRPQSSGPSATREDDEGQRQSDLAERLQSPQIGEQRQQNAQPQQQRSAQGQPQRYHGSRGSRQNAPQYKLQAKVTGLERTGRKDPILRFDVHVSACLP